jgi:hypothetical protein
MTLKIFGKTSNSSYKNHGANSWYNMVNFKDPYIHLMALIYRLYGEKDFSKFSEAWIPLAYTVAISGRSFNWGAIIPKQLSINIP